MSKLEKCSMCSIPALYLCRCSPQAFFCSSHLHTHCDSAHGTHIVETLRYKVLPEDLQIFRNIKNYLDSVVESKAQAILSKRTQRLRPLLLQIQEIEKECKEELKRDLKEEIEKIGEIEEILRVGEVRGSLL